MTQASAEVLRNIYPLSQLPGAALDELRPKTRIVEYRSGQQLFEIGESPNDYFYVVVGDVRLDGVDPSYSEMVSSTARAPSIPLPYLIPSFHRACTTTNAQILLVDRQLLMDILRKYKPHSPHALEMSYRAEATDSLADGWQGAFLRAPGFRRIAPNDLQRAFGLMKPLTFRRGDVVIEQGAPADYFYVLAEGRCEVLRMFIGGRLPTRVAGYGPGATLGEDALISGYPRNATVRMLTDGCVMRMEGDDFRFLIKRALLRSVEYAEAREMIARGSQWLDVRMPEERGDVSIPGSIAIPHPIVRARLFAADADRSYIVVCANGHDSAVIAFTLCKYGFDAYYLREGTKALSSSNQAPP